MPCSVVDQPDNAVVIDHALEISLGWCVLLNVAVFGSAWWFAARRVTASRSQAVLDAVLLGYAVQYLAVGLPGMIGQLRPMTIAITAIVFSTALIAIAWRRSNPLSVHPRHAHLRSGQTYPIFPLAMASFTVAFLLAFVQSQASLPVIPNDALTYHFPAAVQWLQRQRIDLYQTWFFNPANTYSPLAGSTFIVWLLAPFGSDVLARFVEVPALLCVGLAVYRLARQLEVRSSIAAATAAAAVLCRPMFLQCMMGKDDLFLAFFFIATLVALAEDRRREKYGACRIGVASGLLLATKFTAILAAPILLIPLIPLFHGPARKAWAMRHIAVTGAVALLLAGPWYFRNWWLTRNPIFPVDVSLLGVHLFHGLFTSTVSEGLRPIASAVSVVVGGSYGLPTLVAVVLGVGWIAGMIVGFGSLRSAPLLCACLIGPVLGFVIFYACSPFPEVRFVVPDFLLLFAVAGFAVDRVLPRTVSDAVMLPMVAFFPLISLVTIFVPRLWLMAAPLAGAGVVVMVLAVVVSRFDRWKMNVIGAMTAVLVAGYGYVQWNAYCKAYQSTLHVAGSGYDQNYPTEEMLWGFVDEHVPSNAVVAYSNLYMTYPLYGFDLRRGLVYAPTRQGVRTIADLPWLGDRLSGEKLVSAAKRATTASADRAVWLRNLRDAGAAYLIVGAGRAPELEFVRDQPRLFRLLYNGPAGRVYEVRDSFGGHAPLGAAR